MDGWMDARMRYATGERCESEQAGVVEDRGLSSGQDTHTFASALFRVTTWSISFDDADEVEILARGHHFPDLADVLSQIFIL